MLTLCNVCKHYPGSNRPAVNNVNMHMHKGEFLCLVGQSGSGKTTLLNIMSSLILPDSGQVLFNGQDICSFREKDRNALRSDTYAMIFQQHHLLPYLTALENVLLPAMKHCTLISATAREKARQMLDWVGLADKEHAMPGQLSGGEQQRVAIARALTRNTALLFADEPTGSLDSTTGDSIMELLHAINKQGVSIVMVTHNLTYARAGHRVVTMADGTIAAA